MWFWKKVIECEKIDLKETVITGKRWSKRKPPLIKEIIEPLQIYVPLFDANVVKINSYRNAGMVSCKICMEKYKSSTINHLFESTDVYCNYIASVCETTHQWQCCYIVSVTSTVAFVVAAIKVSTEVGDPGRQSGATSPPNVCGAPLNDGPVWCPWK